MTPREREEAAKKLVMDTTAGPTVSLSFVKGDAFRSVFLDDYYGHPALRWSEMPEAVRQECLSDPRTGHIFRKLFGNDKP